MKRLYAIISILVIAAVLIAPLLLAQYSDSNNSQPADIGGSWQLSWQGREGSQQATVQIQQDGSKLNGTFQGSSGSSQLTGGVQGNNVSFSVQVQGRRTITLGFTGRVDGDKMTGTLQPQGGRGGHGGGSYSWSGVRQQGNSGGRSQPE
jgi:hypothetical protein